MSDSDYFFEDELMAPKLNELDRLDHIIDRMELSKSEILGTSLMDELTKTHPGILAPNKEELFKVEMISQSLKSKKDLIIPLKALSIEEEKSYKYQVLAFVATIIATLFFAALYNLPETNSNTENVDNQLNVNLEAKEKNPVEPVIENIAPVIANNDEDAKAADNKAEKNKIEINKEADKKLAVKEKQTEKELKKEVKDTKIAKEKIVKKEIQISKKQEEKSKTNKNKIIKKLEIKEPIQPIEKIVQSEIPKTNKNITKSENSDKIDLSRDIQDLKNQLAVKLPEKREKDLSEYYKSTKTNKVTHKKKSPTMQDLIQIEKNVRPVVKDDLDDNQKVYMSKGFRNRMRTIAKLDKLSRNSKVSFDKSSQLNLKQKRSQINRDYLLLLCYKLEQWKSIRSSGKGIPKSLENQMKILFTKFGFNANLNDPYDVQVSLTNIFGSDARSSILLGRVLYRIKKMSRLSKNEIEMAVREINQIKMTASGKDQAIVDFLESVGKKLSLALKHEQTERVKMLKKIEKEIALSY